MTIKEILNGIDYTIECSYVKLPKTVQVKKFLKKAREETVYEEWVIYKVKNTKKTGNPIIEVRGKFEPNSEIKEHYVEVNGVQQNCEESILRQIFEEVSDLFGEQELEKLHKETMAKQLKWNQKKNAEYKRIADEIQKIK